MFLFGKGDKSSNNSVVGTGNTLISASTEGCNPTVLVLRGEKNVPTEL
jgi:hypothetical protein